MREKPTPRPADLAPYMEEGYQLVPINRWDARDERGPRGKSPRDSRWLQRGYPYADVERWVESGGNAGVRLTDSDVVVDVDPRNAPGGDAAEVLSWLGEDFGFDPRSCPTVRTGSGGLHLYARLPEPMRVRNSLPGLPGVEFKSAGRQVLAAGSVHPCGRHYEWDEFAPPLPEAPVLPAALVEAIRRREPERREVGGPDRLDPAHVASLVRQLDVADYRDHDEWFELMQSAHYASGGDLGAREAFVEWCTADPPYADHGEQIRARWHSLHADPEGPAVATGTLLKRVVDAGGNPNPPAAQEFGRWEEPEDEEGPRSPKFTRNKDGTPKSSYANALEGVKALGIRPEYDELHDRIALRGDLGPIREVHPHATEVWSDSLMLAVSRLLVERFRLEVPTNRVQDAVKTIALERPFNPLLEYLDPLAWDGKPRVDSWLVDYVGAEDTPYVRGVGRLMLLGAVARAYRPGVKFDSMVVLEGPQGTFKSTLLRKLGGEWTLEGIPHKNPNDRDVVDAMLGYWIVEMEELASLRRSDVDSLKAFLSRTRDRARLAYARNSEDFPRRCVFVGTTNDTTYLTDMTGNRRFLPVRIGRIKVDAVERDRDQLWAEAVREWKRDPRPETLVLERSLWSAAAAEQESRRHLDPWEEVVQAYLEGVEGDVVKAKEVLWECCQRGPADVSRADYMRLAGVMQRLGWSKVRVRESKKSNPVAAYRRPGSDATG